MRCKEGFVIDDSVDSKDGAVCPYCGCLHLQADEPNLMTERGGKFDCAECGKTIICSANITIVYTTEKA